MMDYIYFDHNATTEVLPRVRESVSALFDKPYNASSIHYFGRKAKGIIEDARRAILNSQGANIKDYDVIFTSSGTEANNMLVRSFEDANLFLSSIEHLSLLEAAKDHKKTKIINVDHNGSIKLDELEKLLSESDENEEKVVSVMLANNETGVIQDIKTIAQIVHKHGAILHSDITQGYGKIEINLEDLDIDLATISAHKIGGTFGAGALIKKAQIQVKPLLLGGGQEKRMRAGTENTHAILGFGEAASMIKNTISAYSKVQNFRDYIERRLLNAKIYCKDCARLPNTSCLAMPGVNSEAQVIKFDLEGFAVSAGSACSSGKINYSHVLYAMNPSDTLINNAIRISLGSNSTMEEAEKFASTWEMLHGKNITKKIVMEVH